VKLVVAGIGTGVGKTVVSAILCQALGAAYWKPVQAGDLDDTDSMKVRRLVESADLVVHPEAFRLSQACSPHAAAEFDGVVIRLEDLSPPKVDGSLVIELAGGLMVPLSSTLLNVDLVQHLDLPIVLVANYYLGSINHTLLSLDLIKQRQLNLLGVVLNGEPNKQSREAILGYSGVNVLAEIPQAEDPDRSFVTEQAARASRLP
jgi:dethiobiotin synthetase